MCMDKYVNSISGSIKRRQLYFSNDNNVFIFKEDCSRADSCCSLTLIQPSHSHNKHKGLIHVRYCTHWVRWHFLTQSFIALARYLQSSRHSVHLSGSADWGLLLNELLASSLLHLLTPQIQSAYQLRKIHNSRIRLFSAVGWGEEVASRYNNQDSHIPLWS